MIASPSRDEFDSAVGLLDGVAVRTPLVPLHDPDSCRHQVLLKPEVHQIVGSFKIRGVYHAVARLGDAARARGLSTVSAGNTAQALAWCGRRFGVHARSLMPDSAPRNKIDAVRRLGADAVLVPTAELFRYLRERAWESEPYTFIHPWTDRDVMIGHGTIGLEILDERPDLSRVFVPVGGGGLIAGVAAAIKERDPSVRVIGVEPSGCPALHASFENGRPVEVDCRTICDGVAVPYITDEMFPLLRELVDEIVLVPEDEVREAIRVLALRERIVAEGAGALALAAAMRSRAESGVSVCLVTGGSIDAAGLIEILRGPGGGGLPTG